MSKRRVHLKCWIALCQAVLEGRQFSRIDLLYVQLPLI